MVLNPGSLYAQSGRNRVNGAGSWMVTDGRTEGHKDRWTDGGENIVSAKSFGLAEIIIY